MTILSEIIGKILDLKGMNTGGHSELNNILDEFGNNNELREGLIGQRRIKLLALDRYEKGLIYTEEIILDNEGFTLRRKEERGLALPEYVEEKDVSSQTVKKYARYSYKEMVDNLYKGLGLP